MKLPVVKLPAKLPDIKPLDKREDGRPCFSLEFPFDVIINGKTLTIPAGVEFDYASVPKIFTNIFPPNDPDWQAASLLHDIAYQAELWDRKYNDSLFLATMVATGTKKISRTIMWLAVRIGGGFTYKKHSTKSKMQVRRLMGIESTLSPCWARW